MKLINYLKLKSERKIISGKVQILNEKIQANMSIKSYGKILVINRTTMKIYKLYFLCVNLK